MPHNTSTSITFNQEFDYIREEFLAELPDRIESIEQLLMDCEKQENQKESLREVFRIIHSLKGGSSSFQMTELTVILHQFEDLVGDVRKQVNKNNFIEQCLAFVDYLYKCAEFITNNKTQELPEYLSKFQVQLFETNNFIGRALIIDESRSTIKGIQRVLDNLNIDSTVESDGAAGLNLLISEHFDLVLMSQNLPSLDGQSIISALKIMKVKNQNIPAILLTSNYSKFVTTNDDYSPDHIIAKNKGFFRQLSRIARSIFQFDSEEDSKTKIRKILYIEDDKITQKIFKANISKIKDMKALIIDKRDDIIPSISEFRPDIILLDNLLVGFTGHDVLKDLNKCPAAKAIPIIMMTASPQDLDLSELQQLGQVKDILSKPFHIKSFMDKLQALS